MDYSYY